MRLLPRDDATAPILYGVTIPLSARAFLVGQLNVAAAQRSGIHLVYGTEGEGPIREVDSRVVQHQVPVRRNPSLWQDLLGLWHLVLLMRSVGPGTVFMGTPKMGLLGLMAARLLRVPRRIYVLYGLRLEGARGLGRVFLWFMERISMSCATEILAISQSNRSEALRLRLTKRSKISVVGQGNIVGVDLARFRCASAQDRAEARHRFVLPADAPVVGFVGRLTPDKGLVDMVSVWQRVSEQRPEAWFLVVGPDEASERGLEGLVGTLRGQNHVRLAGAVDDPETAFSAMDVLLLLTKREGFGTVVIEAGACGVPAVATRVSGVVDAISDGETGTLVALGDHEAAAEAVLAYLDDSALRIAHGQAARQRVQNDFEARHVTTIWVERVLGMEIKRER